MSIDIKVGLYIELMIISMILPLFIYIRIKADKQDSSDQRAFTKVLGSILITMLCVGVGYSVNGKSGNFAKIVNYIVNIIRPISGGFTSFEWLWFVLFKMKCSYKRKSTLGILSSVPYAVLVIMSLISPKTGWIFRMTSTTNYYLDGTLHVVLYAIYVGYLLAAFIYCVYKYRKSKQTSDERKFSRIFIGATISFTVAFVLQLLFERLPVLTPASAVILAIVYLYLTNTQVVVDSLTGVNNRNQFDKYLHSEVERKNRTRKMYLMLFDMDDFKSINDGFGHDVGDDALKITAGAIKHTYGEYGGFIARFGGDEFAAILEADDKNVPCTLCQKLTDELDSINATKAYPFELHISTGIAEFMESDDETSFFKKADLDMYNSKKANKQKRAEEKARIQ